MTTDAEPIPSLRFRGETLPPAARLAAFRQLTPGYDVTLPAGAPVDDFTVSSRAWMLDTLLLHTSRISPVDIARTPDHIRRDRRDTYSFILLKHGGWRGLLDDGTVQVGSGQITVMDFAETWQVSGTAQENIMLVVPRDLIARIAPEAPPLHGRTFDGPGGRLFAEHLLALARHLPAMTARDIPLMRDATLALLTSALAALPAPPASRARVQPRPPARVRAFIEERLGSPDLGIDAICHALGMTRATLYRASGAGGIAAYIRRRRLEAAHARIADPDETASVVEIAEASGFASHAHFTTAFRRCFGYTPRDARGRPPSTQGAKALFDRWSGVLDN